MFDAEYTHEGEHCTFEALLERFALDDPALRAVGEIVHDIDMKDARFGRAETPGIAQLISGLVLAHDSDAARLERGAATLDDLYAALKEAPIPSPSTPSLRRARTKSTGPARRKRAR
jgi:hypothetical protein